MEKEYKSVPEVAAEFGTNQTKIKRICNLMAEDIPKFVRRNNKGDRQLSNHNLFIIAAVLGFNSTMDVKDAVDCVKKEYYGINR